MGKFKGSNHGPYMPQAAPAEPQMVEIPELSQYTVRLINDNEAEVPGHTTEVKDGCLFILRAIYGNEDCTASRIIATDIFPAGEWKRCSTGYMGFTKSPLAI